MKKYKLTDTHRDLLTDDEYLAVVAGGLVDKQKILEGKTILEASRSCQFARVLEGHEDLTIDELLETIPVHFVVDTRIKANDFMANAVKNKCLEQVIARGDLDVLLYYHESVKDKTAAEKQLAETALESHPSYAKKLRVTSEEKAANKIGKREDRIAARKEKHNEAR